MAASSRQLERVAALVAAVGLGACSVGVGAGEVAGQVHAPDCELREAPFRIDPDFFVAAPVEDHLELRVQRGSSFADVSDGLLVTVLGASEVRERLGEPLPVVPRPEGEAAEPVVAMTLYLNATCPPSSARPPLVLEATEGRIVFEAIYAPSVDPDETEIAARFEGVEATDRAGRGARFSGWFRFNFNRGRPAQRFP